MTGWLVGLLYVTVVGAGLLVWATTRQRDREALRALETALEARERRPPPAVPPPPDVAPLVKSLLEGVALIVQGPPGPSPSGVTGAPGQFSQEGEEQEVGPGFIPSWETDETWIPEDPTELEGEWSGHTVPWPNEVPASGESIVDQMFGNGGLRLPDLD